MNKEGNIWLNYMRAKFLIAWKLNNKIFWIIIIKIKIKNNPLMKIKKKMLIKPKMKNNNKV